MPTAYRVVARLSDGRVFKGATHDFNPTRPRFHLVPTSGDAPLAIRCDELKALFFVKTLEGDSRRTKLRGFLGAPAETPQGRKIAVQFKDGEILCGYSLTYAPGRSGFFILPADTKGNNLRAFVVTAATAAVKVGPAAEALALRVLAGRS